MKKMNYSRRNFLSNCLSAGSIFLGGAFILNSCEPKQPPEADKKEAASKNACDDLSGVSKSEIEKREKFGYADKSPDPENNCGNCSMFVPQGQDKECGGCLLFKGPVHSLGYCIQYVAKV
jgi:hypothetical protein